MSVREHVTYQAPWWLPGGHLQTIWAALWARREAVSGLQRHRWTTPDGDFIDVDRQVASRSDRPQLVLFHGLEGSSASHYAWAWRAWAQRHDLHCVIPHFRGCSGVLNLAPRAYHSGDHAEVAWILGRLRQQHRQQGGSCQLAVGVSLGGNALMRWAAEEGAQAVEGVDAAAAVCAPLDLTASAKAIGQGLNRQIYTRMFLRSMKPRALAKWHQYPGLFDRDRMLKANDLEAFDEVFTAPLHGFKDARDYWAKASAKPMLRSVRLPVLLLNARNDPFIPAQSLPSGQEVSPSVTLWQPEHGGHVGFVQGRCPGGLQWVPEQVGAWLLAQVANTRGV